LALVQIDVTSPGDANTAIAALRKVEAIVSVRLVALGKL
jgi:D-3-phosphoglycerate dehydrogenase